MKVLDIFVTLFLLIARAVYAADGPIDWSRAPGGGPSTLRACASYAYNDNARGGGSVNGYLGCSTIACVCRTDLIDAAHQHIKDIVVLNCGENEVDIAAATKLYDDYCSSNGFAIPGYTYVSTQTVRISSETPRKTAPTTLTPTPVGASNSINTPTAATVTSISTVALATVTAASTTTATSVFRSHASPRLQPWSWFSLVCFLASTPKMAIFVLSDSSVVTYTSSNPPPAESSVTTIFELIPTAPALSTQTVVADPANSYSSPLMQTTDTPSTNSNSGGSSGVVSGNRSGDSGGKGLSTLEVAGIVIGIVVGLVTTIATVWMCARGTRGIAP